MKIDKYSYKDYKDLFSDFFVFKKLKTHGNAEHVHDFIEIVYVIDGRATEIVDKTPYVLRKGDVLIMNYRCHHTIEKPVNFSYFNLLIYCDNIEERKLYFNQSFMIILRQIINSLPQKKHGKISFSVKETNKIENLFENILEEQKKEKKLYNIMREVYLTNLLILISRKQEVGVVNDDFVFNDILTCVDLNFTNNYLLEDYARKFNYNTTYFSRLFKNKTGKTYRQYVLERKMIESANLLKNTNMSVESVIEIVGYENHSAFYRNFYKVYKMTPTQYREKNKKAETNNNG